MERPVGIPSMVPPYLPNQGGVSSLESVYSLVLAIANQQQALQLQMNQFVMMQEEQNARVRDQLQFLVDQHENRTNDSVTTSSQYLRQTKTGPKFDQIPRPDTNHTNNTNNTHNTSEVATGIESIPTRQPSSVDISNISQNHNKVNDDPEPEVVLKDPITQSNSGNEVIINNVLPPELTQHQVAVQNEHQPAPRPSTPSQVANGSVLTASSAGHHSRHSQPVVKVNNRSSESASQFQNTYQRNGARTGNRVSTPDPLPDNKNTYKRDNNITDSTLSVDYRDLVKLKTGTTYNPNDSNGYFTESDFSPEVREFLDDVGLT
eukprot:TRINITY_DN754_c2_g3_i1.p1 TRINITY_DN754_c2_g3~~TRINITY_DN754_c2_g3_i1.p1  ORF type:complete len:319 (+),score=69.89 TRINITY_DN754_c2_g3_i1:43-999(+)